MPMISGNLGLDMTTDSDLEVGSAARSQTRRTVRTLGGFAIALALASCAFFALAAHSTRSAAMAGADGELASQSRNFVVLAVEQDDADESAMVQEIPKLLESFTEGNSGSDDQKHAYKVLLSIAQDPMKSEKSSQLKHEMGKGISKMIKMLRGGDSFQKKEAATLLALLIDGSSSRTAMVYNSGTLVLCREILSQKGFLAYQNAVTKLFTLLHIMHQQSVRGVLD